MAALDDLLRVIPVHEKERLQLASLAQRELLEFYATAHADILKYFEGLFPTTDGIQGALSPAEYFEASRMSALSKFIEARAATLNTAVAHAMANAADNIRDLVITQVAKEAKALGLDPPIFGTPDPRLLERTIDDAVSRIKEWNKQWSPDMLRNIREGLLRGESYRELAARATSTKKIAQGKSSAVARARAHMLANIRFSVVAASNQARQQSYEGAQKEGIKVQKMWWSAIGSCCFSCAKLHGTIVDMDKDFPWKSIGIKLKPYKGELAHPPLHPNCRCRIIPVTLEIFDAIDMDQIKITKTNRLETLALAGIR